MTEPTDAELDELRQANSGRLNFVTLSEFRTIARAVIAKWGTPQPTQAQAGAVPLTPEAINVMAREYPAEDLCGWSYHMGVADAEKYHGIKGGQQ